MNYKVIRLFYTRHKHYNLSFKVKCVIFTKSHKTEMQNHDCFQTGFLINSYFTHQSNVIG